MIDVTEALKMALQDFGRPALLGGNTIAHGVLFNPAPSEPDPYALEGSGQDVPSCVLLRSDLEAIDEWPLYSTDIEVNDKVYRILRHDDVDGEVTLYLREAE